MIAAAARTDANSAASKSRRARASRAHMPTPIATIGAASLQRKSHCACGGCCPRCTQLAAPAAGGSALAAPPRPDVVIDPKTKPELQTEAFRTNYTLTEVMRGRLFLMFGATGKAVRLLQEALVASEVRDPATPQTRLPKFGVDGIFGAETKAAVEAFQQEYGLTADGIVGQQTLYWLDETFRDYKKRPEPAAGKKLPARFPSALKSTLQKPSSVALTMTASKPVATGLAGGPRIEAEASFSASVVGTHGEVFYEQNIRHIERKRYWKRTVGCTTDCEQAHAYVGKAQGLDTEIPYLESISSNTSMSLNENIDPQTGKSVARTLPTADHPELLSESDSPQGAYQTGDTVTLFAHDQFRMFLAFGPVNASTKLTEFEPLGFIDWQWKGKADFTFDGKNWSAGAVQNRIDPTPSAMNQSKELIFLGPVYDGDQVTGNLRSDGTKVNEKPANWI